MKALVLHKPGHGSVETGPGTSGPRWLIGIAQGPNGRILRKRFEFLSWSESTRVIPEDSGARSGGYDYRRQPSLG